MAIGDTRKEAVAIELEYVRNIKDCGEDNEVALELSFRITKEEGFNSADSLYTSIIEMLSNALGTVIGKGMQVEPLLDEDFWRTMAQSVHSTTNRVRVKAGESSLPELKLNSGSGASAPAGKSVVVELHDDANMTVQFNDLREPEEMCVMTSMAMCSAMMRAYPTLKSDGKVDDDTFDECVRALRRTLDTLVENDCVQCVGADSAEEAERLKNEALKKTRAPRLTVVK